LFPAELGGCSQKSLSEFFVKSLHSRWSKSYSMANSFLHSRGFKK
jgi:hypothetical protein